MIKSKNNYIFKQQKIAIICPRTKEYCGVYDYSFILANNLSAQKNLNTTLITNKNDFHIKESAFSTDTFITKWNFCETVKLAYYLRNNKFDVASIQLVGWMYGRYGCPLPLAILTVLLRLFRIKIVLTAHELYVPMVNWRWKILGILQRIAFFAIAINASAVIVPVEKWQKLLQQNLLLRNKEIRCIPIFSNIEKHAEKLLTRESLGIKKSDFVITVFSPNGSGKMMENIIKVFNQLKISYPNILLCMIGCEKKRKRNGIISIKQSPESEISNILSLSDAYFCPFMDGVSARRGSLIAAMQHGLPIVTTKGEATDDFLYNSPIAMTEINDTNKMIAEIQKMIIDPKYRVEVGKKTKEFYDKNFGIGIVVSEYTKIFDDKTKSSLVEKYYELSSAQYDLAHGANEDEHEIALGILSGLINKFGLASLIDVGAGTGRVQAYLNAQNPHLTKILGVEPSSAMREIAYTKDITKNNLIEGTGEKLNVSDKSFDVSCSFGILHHVPDSGKIIKEMLRVSKKAIFISDNNNYGEGSLLKRVFKQSLRALRLWKLFKYIKTKGRGYLVLDGDGPHYPYSIFDDINLIKKHCDKVYLFDTAGNGKDLFRNSSHVAMLGIINEK